MAVSPKYDDGLIDYTKAYYKVDPDEVIRPAFNGNGGIKIEAREVTGDDGETRTVKVPVIAETLTLVRIGTFRKSSEKVDRPVFQTEQTQAYATVDLARFKKATKALDAHTVEANGKPATVTAEVAGF